MTDDMLDEICGAKEYAEKYVEYKAKGDTSWANKFKEMANDELKHAMYIHDLVTKEIDEISKVFQPTQKMLDKWEHDHKEYTEKYAWVKQMLTM